MAKRKQLTEDEMAFDAQLRMGGSWYVTRVRQKKLSATGLVQDYFYADATCTVLIAIVHTVPKTADGPRYLRARGVGLLAGRRWDRDPNLQAFDYTMHGWCMDYLRKRLKQRV